MELCQQRADCQKEGQFAIQRTIHFTVRRQAEENLQKSE
jgi:hypothetical protein